MNYRQKPPQVNPPQPYVVCGPPRCMNGDPWPREMQHTHDITITMPSPTPDPNHSLMDKLWMRTGWSNLEAPFYAFHMVNPPDGDKVLIWVAKKDGTHVALEDDKAMFPSDALVTKLMMLKE